MVWRILKRGKTYIGAGSSGREAETDPKKRGEKDENGDDAPGARLRAYIIGVVQTLSVERLRVLYWEIEAQRKLQEREDRRK